MTKRYYFPSLPTDDRVTLDGPEAHHLLHVMRAEKGDQITLFDGTGGEFPAHVAERHRDRVVLDIGPRVEVDRELSVELIVGVAMPKGDRQKWLVEKLTELGVARLVPLATDRGVAEVQGKSLDRLARSVVEASKQCGRNRLMEISESQTVADFLGQTGEVRLLADPSGSPLGGISIAGTGRVVVAIGPEGGWSDKELDSASRLGWRVVSLGPSILRVETAAIAITAWLANR